MLAFRFSDQVRDVIAVAARTTRWRKADSRDMKFTAPAKQSLERAMSEARQLDHATVNTGHLLLGVTSGRNSIARDILADLGVSEAQARQTVTRLELTERDGTADRPERPVEMTGVQAADLLRRMATSTTVAAVFAEHGVDVDALVRDLARPD